MLNDSLDDSLFDGLLNDVGTVDLPNPNVPINNSLDDSLFDGLLTGENHSSNQLEKSF